MKAFNEDTSLTFHSKNKGSHSTVDGECLQRSQSEVTGVMQKYKCVSMLHPLLCRPLKGMEKVEEN